jgi:hypothetical protein
MCVIIRKVSCNFIFFSNISLLCGCDSHVCVCVCVCIYIYIYNISEHIVGGGLTRCGLQPFASSMLIT